MFVCSGGSDMRISVDSRRGDGAGGSLRWEGEREWEWECCGGGWLNWEGERVWEVRFEMPEGERECRDA